MNARRVQRTRLATSAVKPVTSPVIATTQLLRVPDAVVEDSAAVVEDRRSVTRYVDDERILVLC